MNETIFDHGGPAFPHPDEGRYLNPEKGTGWVPQTGMTLWDHYATAALQGHIIAHAQMYGFPCPLLEAGQEAGYYADAMLAERRKRFNKQETTE